MIASVWPVPSVPVGHRVDVRELRRGVADPRGRRGRRATGCGARRRLDRPGDAQVRAGLRPVIQTQHGDDDARQRLGDAERAFALPMLDRRAARRIGAAHPRQPHAEEVGQLFCGARDSNPS